MAFTISWKICYTNAFLQFPSAKIISLWNIITNFSKLSKILRRPGEGRPRAPSAPPDSPSQTEILHAPLHPPFTSIFLSHFNGATPFFLGLLKISYVFLLRSNNRYLASGLLFLLYIPDIPHLAPSLFRIWRYILHSHPTPSNLLFPTFSFSHEQSPPTPPTPP